MPHIYDELVDDRKFVFECGRYTKLRYFLTRGSSVKLKDTFLDNKGLISKFVCYTLDKLDQKT